MEKKKKKEFIFLNLFRLAGSDLICYYVVVFFGVYPSIKLPPAFYSSKRRFSLITNYSFQIPGYWLKKKGINFSKFI